MGRGQSQTPALVDYGDESGAEGSYLLSSESPSGQVPIADDSPPPYTDISVTISTPTQPLSRHHIESFNVRAAVLDHDEYDILSAKTYRDGRGSKTTVISNSLASDAKLLRDFISAQSRLMPNPLVRMVGTHTETQERRKSDENTTVTDFDISISASDLLAPTWRRTRVVENGMKAYRGGRRKSVATGYQSDLESTHSAPRLEEWYHRFCASAGSLKTFTLSHRITNRDDQYLKDALHGVLRSTNYRGDIWVTFPLEQRATVVMSDHPFNRYRTNSWIWWACVILPLWIITWPVLWFMTQHWKVVSVEWPCRIYQRPDGGWPNSDEQVPGLIHEGICTAPPGRRGAGQARVAVMSEAEWVESWRAAIMRAAESRTQGMLYASDRDATNAIERRNAERDWETRQRIRTTLRGSFADAALGFLRGASDTLRNSRMARRGWGANN